MLLFPPKNLCLCSKLWIRKDFLKFYMMEETYMLTQCNTMLMDFFFFQKKLSFGTNGYFQSKHDSSSINQQSLLD